VSVSLFNLVMLSNMHEEIWKMLTNFGKRKMSSATLTSTTRSALSLLVEREARRVGSRTVAYEIVAQTIGVSSSWIRKFLARDESVSEPRMTLFQNIRASYDALCSRVEQEHQTELQRIAALRSEMNAVDEGFVEVVHRADQATVDGED
jgi:hypothetical protein